MSKAQAMRDLLGPKGPLARRLDDWERRPEQEELCAAIAASIDRGGTLVAEAGTGVGKSFAYLLPAILRAEATGRQVIVSTRTKALQEQIADKDLPFLQAVLPNEFTWAVAVGRGNYVCLRRLEQAVKSGRELFGEVEDAAQLERILAWSRARPEHGVRNELPFVPEARIWGEVQAEQGNCLGPECRWFAPCHWQRAKRVMRTANILIVNHSLYFADLALRIAGFAYLPDHDCVIFDEAHHLESVASEALGLHWGPSKLEWQLSRLANRSGSRGLLIRLGMVDTARDVQELRRRADGYFDPARQRAETSAQVTLQPSDVMADDLSEGLDRLGHELEAASDGLEREQQYELGSRARALFDLAAQARAFARPATDGEVRWIERARRDVVLRSAPVSVAGLLREHLFGRVRSSILVSATLGPAQGDFAWLRDRLGIDTNDAIGVGSPFPYACNVDLTCVEGLPDPAAQTDDFEREAAARIAELCVANAGRALVLCTSWRFVRACSDRVASDLTSHDIELLVQGDRPLSQLIDRKREQPRSVLIGTDTLWEGIDIPGASVTLVVIPRFPFPVPSQPLAAARIRAIERSGKSSFAHYSLPLAVLKFRQGFGRLVRSATDCGRVVVLDPRARRRAYGRSFLDSVPRCREA